MTDPRFFIADNVDVLDFIRRENPSAHSDVGTVLFDCIKQVDGARGYCPSAATYAYVVMHTDAYRIAAIAYGMRRLAVRLSSVSQSDAIAAGNEFAPAIGTDWVHIDPWSASTRDWVARAYADAVAAKG